MSEDREKEKAKEEISKTETSISELKEKLIELTAEFRKKQQDLNQQIYNQGVDEFSDVNLETLLTSGEAFHKGKIGNCEFVIKTLTKKESLEIDKATKEYIDDTQDYYTSAIQRDILSLSLKEYNNAKAPADMKSAREAVETLSDPVVNLIFNIYSRMTRWVRAALEINLKN